MSEISARCFLFVGNISATICKNLIFKIFYLVRKVFLICAKSDKYEFNISEIQKIKYIKHNNIKRGPQYALVITAGNRELELNKQMEGFDIMVEYLLKKYADGKIDNKVMSKYCKNSLNKINI